jgi:hypothetical protein
METVVHQRVTAMGLIVGPWLAESDLTRHLLL